MVPPSLRVTTIGSPVLCQPCAMPMPNGEVEPRAAPSTAFGSTCTVRPSLKKLQVPVWVVLSPAHPPTSGTWAPATEYAPRTISCWSPLRPSPSSSITRCSASTSSRQEAASIPAS
jgi:hypothetical protein